MSSPMTLPTRARRQSARGRPSWGQGYQDEEEEQEVEEARPGRARRRPGKEPVEESEGEEEYETGADSEDEEERHQQRRRTRTQVVVAAGSRRGRASAGGDEAGPSAKRGRASLPAVKQEPGGGQAGGGQRAAVGAGDARATAGELRALDELIAQYRRLRDSAAEKAEGKAPRMAMEQASRAVVRHMLFANSEKPGAPVKRSEVAALVTARFPNAKSKAAVTAYVIAHAQHYLISSMGIEMRSQAKLTMRGREAALAGGAVEEGAQQYALHSAVPAGLRAAYVVATPQDAQRGLLMTVLSLIYLADGKLAEDELYQQMGEVSFSREAPHPVFGRLSEQLKTFCTRRYIQQDKQQGPDGEIITYHFAEQAVGDNAEIGKEKIQRFIEEQFAAGGGAEQDGQ